MVKLTWKKDGTFRPSFFVKEAPSDIRGRGLFKKIRFCCRFGKKNSKKLLKCSEKYVILCLAVSNQIEPALKYYFSRLRAFAPLQYFDTATVATTQIHRKIFILARQE